MDEQNGYVVDVMFQFPLVRQRQAKRIIRLNRYLDVSIPLGKAETEWNFRTRRSSIFVSIPLGKAETSDRMFTISQLQMGFNSPW